MARNLPADTPRDEDPALARARSARAAARADYAYAKQVFDASGGEFYFAYRDAYYAASNAVREADTAFTAANRVNRVEDPTSEYFDFVSSVLAACRVDVAQLWAEGHAACAAERASGVGREWIPAAEMWASDAPSPWNRAQRAVRARRELCQQQIEDYRATFARDPQRGFTSTQRDAVVKRDGESCAHAQHGSCSGSLQVDHVKPWSHGGRTTVNNAQLLCQSHNGSKSNRFVG